MPFKSRVASKRNSVERITELLMELDNSKECPSAIAEQPGEFLREFYEAWYENGGVESGRPRNSIRRMRKDWLTGKNAVASLHPKLIGQVRQTKRDTEVLVGLFIDRWKFLGHQDGHPELTNDGYAPFPSNDRELLTKKIVAGLFSSDPKMTRDGLLLPSRARVNEFEDEWELAKETMREAEVTIITSRKKSIIGPSISETARRFWHLIDDWYKEDKNDKFPNRMIIWIVDLGEKIADIDDSFEEFCNAGILALLLKMICIFEEYETNAQQGFDGNLAKKLLVPEYTKRSERWKWLSERAVVVVRNVGQGDSACLQLNEEKLTPAYKFRDIGIEAKHYLPREPPQPWKRTLRSLYGPSFVDASNATVSVHLNKAESTNNNVSDVRYLAHAELKAQHVSGESGDGTIDWASSSVTLPNPGPEYDDAYRILHLASKFALHRNDDESNDEYISYLFMKNIGFSLFKISDYLSFFSEIKRLPE